MHKTLNRSKEDNRPVKIHFYHPNHLGSTEFLTNFEGETIQKCVYMPYGETFIKIGGAPHLFNGKERDEESGLYYYGARYYDERTSLFANPDPLWAITPWSSPYCYCLNNPIRFVDRTGLALEESGGTPAKREGEVWTTAQSSTYTVRKNQQIRHGKAFTYEQKNGCWIQGLNDSENAVQSTADHYDQPISTDDLNGTESWMKDLMAKFKEIFDQKDIVEPNITKETHDGLLSNEESLSIQNDKVLLYTILSPDKDIMTHNGGVGYDNPEHYDTTLIYMNGGGKIDTVHYYNSNIHNPSHPNYVPRTR